MKGSNKVNFFLSGWYVFDSYAPFQIEWRGKLWPTAEHAYQAAHFFNTDPDLAEQVRLQRSPRLADEFANHHSDRDDPDWKNIRIKIMKEICRAKLNQHELIRETLYESGDGFLVEANPNDYFWGCGADNSGENNLGKIWMNLRKELNCDGLV